MYKKGSNNRILIGTPYLLNASSPEYKALLVSTFAAQDCFSFECLLEPTIAKNQFKRAFEQGINLAGAYVLLLGPTPEVYNDKLIDCIETELDIVKKQASLSIFALVYDNEQIREAFGFSQYHNPSKKRIDLAGMQDHGDLKVLYWRDAKSLQQNARYVLDSLHRSVPNPGLDLFKNTFYDKSVCFQGFFYSAVHLCIKDYRIQISRRQFMEEGKLVSPVRVWDFHGRFKTLDFANKVYEGFAYIQSNFLYIDAHKSIEPPDDSINIRLFFGNLGLDAIGEQEVLFGSAEGLTSSAAQNFCYKTIVAKVADEEAVLPANHRLQLERHLLLSRKSFVTKLETTTFNQLPNLALEGTKIDKIAHLTGTYRIWTEGRKGKNEVVQSKLVVERNYQAKVYNPIFGKQELHCEIHIGEGLGREKIFFIMRLKDRRASIATVGTMEMPDQDGLLKVLTGSFCSAGRSKHYQAVGKDPHPITEVRGGYFTAMRTDMEELSDFEPCFLTVEEIMDDSQLLSMFRLLKAENGRPVSRKKG